MTMLVGSRQLINITTEVCEGFSLESFHRLVTSAMSSARNDIQHAAVQHILDSVIMALDENPDRRFIYVEMGFFWRWWIQQSDDIRDKVTNFVNDGIVSSNAFNIFFNVRYVNIFL